VLVHPSEALAGLEAFLEDLPASGDLDQGGPRDVAGCVAAPVERLRPISS
jgi:hypothetical protein